MRQLRVPGISARFSQSGQSAKRKVISSHASMDALSQAVSDAKPIIRFPSGGIHLVLPRMGNYLFQVFEMRPPVALSFALLPFVVSYCGRDCGGVVLA